MESRRKSRTAVGELKLMPDFISAAKARRMSSVAACNCAYLALPRPGTAQKASRLAPVSPPSEPNFANSARARSTALFPFVPVRRKMASSSASDRLAGPFANNFSRGLSSSGQSLIAIRSLDFYIWQQQFTLAAKDFLADLSHGRTWRQTHSPGHHRRHSRL